MQQQWHRFPKKPLQFKRILCYLTIGVMNIDHWSCKFHFFRSNSKNVDPHPWCFTTPRKGSYLFPLSRQDVVPRTGLSHETKLPTPHKQDQTHVWNSRQQLKYPPTTKNMSIPGIPKIPLFERCLKSNSKIRALTWPPPHCLRMNFDGPDVTEFWWVTRDKMLGKPWNTWWFEDDLVMFLVLAS